MAMKFGNEFPSGTDTQTTLASSGGLLINIDSATGDVAQTASGWIEDEKYGFYAREFATSTSAEFDSTVTRTGRLTLKLSTLDATGVCRVLNIAAPNFSTAATNLASSGKLIPIKANTKYRYSCYVKTNNAAASSVLVQFQQLTSTGATTSSSSSSLISGTVDWTNLTGEFTTSGTAVWLGLIFYISTAGNISDAWFDVNSMTLEEVVEPVSNSLTSSSPSLVSFTAVGSTDNIDQSQVTQNDARGVGGDGSTAVITNKIAQQFLPSKSKLTGIVFRKIADIGTFTGTVTIKIMNDNAGAIGATTLASYTYTNVAYQALANDTNTTAPLPCNLTVDGSTKYWITMEASTSDASNYARIRVNSGNPYTSGIFQAFYSGAWNTVAFDMYFNTLYYKPTTNFKASQNNLNVSISADEDGFLNGSVINLTTGAYSWGMGATPTDLSMGTNVFRSTAGPGTAVGSQTIIQNYGFYNYNSKNWIGTSATTSTLDLVWKCETILPITSDVIVSLTAITRTTGDVTVAFSTDDSAYTDLGSLGNSSNVQADFSYSTSALIGVTKFYIRVRRSGASSKFDISNLAISTTVNPTSLSILRNYPTNKDIIKQYSTTLGAATTTATYRATKWGFPAIEYSSTEYQYLDVDTTATGSTVAFSELGTSYTTVADGTSIAISSTSTPSIWVKANITANRLYLSSNDYNADSGKDGSNKQSVVYQVLHLTKKTLNYRLGRASHLISYGN